MSSHQKQKTQEISMTRLDCKGERQPVELDCRFDQLPTEQGISRCRSGFCGHDYTIDPAKAEPALGQNRLRIRHPVAAKILPAANDTIKNSK
jgi:hypothetical protein